VPGGFAWRADPRLRWTSPARFTEEQVRAFLRRIAAPTLFVRGEDGWDFPEEMIQARLQCIANVRQVRVPGGHHPHLVAPERVAAVIDAFL